MQKIVKILIPAVFVFLFIAMIIQQTPKTKKNLITKSLDSSLTADYGSGSEDLIVTGKKILTPGEYQYKKINVKKGFLTSTAKNPPKGIVLKAKEKIVIENDGIVDVSGKGYSGPDANSGGGPGTGLSLDYAGTGGSHSGQGGSADVSGKAVPAIYELTSQDESFGSSGGIGTQVEGKGGAGGGFIALIAPEVTVDGKVIANGKLGSKSGGGGAGGKIVIIAEKIIINGQVSANGGIGGTSQIQGAGGGGGGTIIFSNQFTGKGKIEVSGGKGGNSLDIYTGVRGGNGSQGNVYIGNG